jgi:hypothetical protein
MRLRLLGGWLCVPLVLAGVAAGAKTGEPVTGTARFERSDGESSLPERFQLDDHTFSYTVTPVVTSNSRMRLAKVTFPSPVVTPHPNNNTVHCEYFCPIDAGSGRSDGPIRRPGVVVLHILGGDFDLSRAFCRVLAGNGVSALFVKMPYYGERRQPDSPARMVSEDPHEIVRGLTQAVLDVRRAAAWLSAQREIDRDRLGVMGISLGGITAALSAGVEPRFTKVCLLLAGGDMGKVVWESTEMEALRKRWTGAGGTRETLLETLAPVDPVRYAKPLAGRHVLMLNARHDEVVPPACTESLWRAFGEPPIIWWDAGHYTAARYLFDGMAKTVEFFRDETPADEAQSTAK